MFSCKHECVRAEVAVFPNRSANWPNSIGETFSLDPGGHRFFPLKGKKDGETAALIVKYIGREAFGPTDWGR